jgi:small subunit ribosomal protein S27Ae
MKKYEFFKIEGDKINRFRRHCPKCGPGVFLADHKVRLSCGKCGYTEYKDGVKPPRPPKVLRIRPVEKPAEVKKEEPKETPKDEKTKKGATKETPKGKK